MIDPRISILLDHVAARIRRLRLWRGLAVAWFLAALAGAALWALQHAAPWRLDHAVTIIGCLAVAIAAAIAWLAAAAGRDRYLVARQIEATYPELNSCLLAAIEQRPDLPGGKFGFLQDCVIRSALRHARGHDWEQVVGRRQFAGALAANLSSLLLLACVLAGLAWYPAAHTAAIGASPDGPLTLNSGGFSVTVEPGNSEVELGTSLLVLARYNGPQPADSTLVVRTSDGETTRLTMAKSLDDPVFGGRIPAVDGPLDYHVETAGRATQSYHVTVFEYPKLVRADCRLAYPSYTALDERLIEDVRTVSSVEGTEVTLICHLNKPVATATLEEKDVDKIVMTQADDGGPVYLATLRCDRSRKLELKLVDAEGRPNKKPAQFTINVLPNKPPDLKLVFPRRDIEVSPLEESDMKATAWDDFGLKRYGLTYWFGGADPAEIVLGTDAAGRERHELERVVRFEDLQAQPDQLLSYYFWAEDLGPDGAARRTQSDMYFAEVRPFEEIFRQGEQPPGGESQSRQQQPGGENAQASERLVQLQKEIIAATWKLVRRETVGRPTQALAGDAELVYESQGSALEQATALADKLTDAESRRHAAVVTESMLEALSHLLAAKDGPDAALLPKALSAEQAAYQALLKLRAREHRVIRGQRQQGNSSSGGAASRSQQQLQELELTNDENRYETERTAQSNEGQEDRETRQVLSRLSELARRQNDLNERLKELQSALEEARDEARRDEIRRQLKRLQEEEQQVLRDTDELRDRMDRPENQERMADQRQQLDETRDQVRRASEALDDEQVSRAAAAGTRAERDFQELRNEFRRRASSQFGEELREMREAARALDENEDRVAERLSPQDKDGDPARLSSRENRLAPPNGDDEREKLPAEMRKQQERVADLLERMRRTIEEAESTEPLLSQQLYDAAREAQEQDPGHALEAAEQSLRRGLLEDARRQEEIAHRGIGELREGVERAAESVLGDETDSLRRAREQLDRLARELNDEVSQDAPGGEDAERREGRGERRNADSKRTNTERGAERGEKGDDETEMGEGSGERGERVSASDNSPRTNQRSRPASGEQGAGERRSGGGAPRSLSDAAEPNDLDRDGAFAPGLFERGGSTPRGGSNGNRPWAPIAGEDYLDWSDRLRDVEQMVDDPKLQAEAARIRDRARRFRIDVKRHSLPPNWDLVRQQVLGPLAELRDRVAEELLRLTSQKAIVPLDRDPVPPKYSEKTRLYYERLGIGKGLNAERGARNAER
jgi:hypothetical protein